MWSDCSEWDVARDSTTSGSSASAAAVSRAGLDTHIASSGSSFFGTDQRHVSTVTSCRPASLATAVSNAAQFAQPLNYDKNMNVQPIRAHCKHHVH